MGSGSACAVATAKRRRRVALGTDAAAFALAVLLALIAEIVVRGAEPVFRGFFCQDPSIAYPMLPNTVPTWALIFAVFAFPLTAVSNRQQHYSSFFDVNPYS